jgi:hypothetical protein
MPGARYAAMGLMFVFTVFGWFLFRELDVTRIVALVSQNPFMSTPEQDLAAAVVVGMTLVLSTPLFLALAWETWLEPRIEQSAWYLPLQTTAWAAFALAMATFARMSSNDFIYFQF